MRIVLQKYAFELVFNFCQAQNNSLKINGYKYSSEIIFRCLSNYTNMLYL